MEVLDKEVKKFGDGCHIVLGRKYLGKKVEVVIRADDEKDFELSLTSTE